MTSVSHSFIQLCLLIGHLSVTPSRSFIRTTNWCIIETTTYISAGKIHLWAMSNYCVALHIELPLNVFNQNMRSHTQQNYISLPCSLLRDTDVGTSATQRPHQLVHIVHQNRQFPLEALFLHITLGLHTTQTKCWLDRCIKCQGCYLWKSWGNGNLCLTYIFTSH